MIVKKENGKTIIDLNDTMGNKYNNILLEIENENLPKKIEIRNLHVYGDVKYSQLNLIDKFKLLYVVFKDIFLNKG